MSTLANQMLRIFPIFKSVRLQQDIAETKITYTMAKFQTKTNEWERERKRSQKSIGIVFHLFFAHSIPLECGRQVLLLAQLTSLFIFLLWQIMKLDCALRLTWKGKTRIKWPILQWFKNNNKYCQSSTYCTFLEHILAANNEPMESGSECTILVKKNSF